MVIDWTKPLFYRVMDERDIVYQAATTEQAQAAADNNAKMFALQTAAQFLLTELGKMASRCPHLVIQIHHLHDDQHSWSVHQCAECGKVVS